MGVHQARADMGAFEAVRALPTLETIRLMATDLEGKPKLAKAEEEFLCILRRHALTLNARCIRVFVDDIQI
jgi:hypothetical protein